MKNSLYWSLNLPLQYWPSDDGKSARILNYLPRKERVTELNLQDVLRDQTHEEFFETAALHFENLARLMREVAKDPSKHIYYHDEGIQR